MSYRTVGIETTAHAAQPIIARCQTIRSPVEPVAYDWVKLVIVRQGSAILLSEFGERHIKVGDVLVLGTQTLCGSEPEGAITVTAIYLDRDYVIDQIFWQHMSLLTDRLDAQEFAQELYSEPAQILRLGEDRVEMLMPWLDELVALSLDGGALERFFRMQSLLFAVLDVIAPYVKTTTSRNSSTQRRSPHLDRSRGEILTDFLCDLVGDVKDVRVGSQCVIVQAEITQSLRVAAAVRVCRRGPTAGGTRGGCRRSREALAAPAATTPAPSPSATGGTEERGRGQHPADWRARGRLQRGEKRGLAA